MDKAAAAIADEFARPVGPLRFTDMMDVLILVMQVTSLRRVMELAEFRLSENTNGEKVVKQGQEDRYVIRVSRHKTFQHGPCQIFLTPKQEHLWGKTSRSMAALMPLRSGWNLSKATFKAISFGSHRGLGQADNLASSAWWNTSGCAALSCTLWPL